MLVMFMGLIYPRKKDRHQERRAKDVHDAHDHTSKYMTRQPTPRQNHSSSTSRDPLIGMVLADRYRILSRIATGGMGSVYEAEHMLMHSKVAIKVLHPDMLANKEMVARFQREAQAAATIDHPNICAATDFGQTSHGEFYMVMEYLDGYGLDVALGSMQSLGAHRTVHIAQQICGVLEQAHRMRIVHRDLKPENIMLLNYQNDQDFVKVLDFGVARIRVDGEDTRLTRAGVVYGTPAYMSPEQVLGDDIDARADLYALGVMMYEMITGQVPFQANTVPRVMNQHLNEAPAPPSEQVGDDVYVPPALEALILRLMEKKPQDRLQSAMQLREILLEFEGTPDPHKWVMPAVLRPKTQSQEVIAQPAPVIENEPSMPKRFNAMGIGAVAFVVLMIAGIILAMSLSNSTSQANGDDGSVKQVSMTLTKERDAFIGQNNLSALLEAMARGDHDQAIKALETQRTKHAKNAHFHYYMGVAHIGAKHNKEAIDSYQRALLLDARYARDKKLIEDVSEQVMSRDDALRKTAQDLIVNHIKLSAQNPLSTLAYKDRSRRRRKYALETLKAIKGFETLPKWQQLNISLKNAVGCKQHKSVIEEMVKLNNPRVREPLQDIDRAPKRGCGKKNRSDCYQCIREDVAKALETIKP